MADIEKLLADIKNELNITWEDEATDSRIRSYINDGIAFLQSTANETTLDFESGGKPRELIFAYCRYADARATNEFKLNYRSDLIMLRAMTAGEEDG